MAFASSEQAVLALEQQIPKWMAQSQVVGLAIALVADAEILWHRGFGLRKAHETAVIRADTVFEAASLSKPVFAYAVLKLAEAGTLDLDVPLDAYLPTPYLTDEPRLARITARHVLSHTPGFPNWRPEGKSLRIMFSPGERFSYSGEGYVYLQKVVEHLVGQSLDDWMQTGVLKLLNMHDSSYVWRDAYDQQVAHGHDSDGPVAEHRFIEANAAFSLYTTAQDFARFVIQMMRPADKEGYLSSRGVSLMLRSQVRVSEEIAWGLGWGIQRDGDERAFWHWGNNPGFKALVVGQPSTGGGLVCFSNSNAGDRLWADILQVVSGKDQPALAWLFGQFYGN